MGYNYYLVNGKDGKAKKIKYLNGGKLVDEFVDLSTLDLCTMDIKYEDRKEVLSEFNDKLGDVFCDVSYPHNKTEMKTYAPLFNYSNEKTKYYMDALRYFAEQRNYKKENNQKVAIDNNEFFNNYIKVLIHNILSTNYSGFVKTDSLIAAKLKDYIVEKHTSKSNVGVDNYFYSRIYVLRNFLSNYNQLRNVTLEYIKYLNKTNYCSRSILSKVKNWDITGINVEENGELKPEFYQYNLSDMYPKTFRLTNEDK